MVRGVNWIGARCSAGKSFDAEVRRWAEPCYDEVIFIDLGLTNSGVSGDGDSWDNPTKNFNDACDKLSNTGGDKSRLFVLRGRVTSGNMMGVDQCIDVRHVTVVGEGTLYGGATQNATITMYHTNTQTTGGTAYDPSYTLVGIKADERNVNFHGLHFYNPDVTDNTWELAWGDSDGQTAAVTDCWFEGQNDGDTTDATCGIYAAGTIHNVFARNQFSYTEIGLAGRGGSSRYFHNATIDRNTFSSNATSIHLLANSSMNLVRDNVIRQKGYLGYNLVAGIDCDTGANYNQFLDNIVFDASETAAYLDGGTGNFWIGNKYGESTVGEGNFYDVT